ncbi:leucyl aminopeptidase [uncultured Anaerococcus sp.]|uniref:leucyl aminopeptidase n=1 Tax=uncultured Anaerococcus sp. TaxID=293428 RepID=UPI0025E5E034|nr:leucyl aminopeptidase [uncultured Anaerococcus sp.]
MKFNFTKTDKNPIVFAFKKEVNQDFFKANKGEILPSQGKIQLGLGDKEKFDKNVLKEVFAMLAKFLKEKDVETISINENPTKLSDKDFILAIGEASMVGLYDFDHYKSDKKDNLFKEINFSQEFAQYEKDLDELKKVLDGQFLARDLVNLRSNDIYPESLANKASENLKDLGVDVKVYGKEEILDMGLTAFYEVAKGSDKEPKFIVMEYLKGDKDKAPLALVGKGLTYDAGGYSIKTSNGMKTMNSDMGGSGTVIGAMRAIALNKLEVNVVAIVAACENLISGRSYKPGDIIKARNGMTIDVDNTDAEGRITLADAVNYAVTEYKPALLVDLATLTGAALGALGETYTASVTNNQEAFDKIQQASNLAHEKIWLLPNDPFFKTYNESENGDIKNSGGRLAGTITAGQFIENFVEEYPWVHLDIAGTAYLSAPQGINGKGATGVHVKTLYELAKDY